MAKLSPVEIHDLISSDLENRGYFAGHLCPVLVDTQCISDFKRTGRVPVGYRTVVIEGRLKRLFTQKSNNWFSGLLETPAGDIVVCGTSSCVLSDVNGKPLDVMMSVRGLWTRDDLRYKPSITASNQCIITPRKWTKESVIHYFSSEAFPGIGAVAANMIWKRFGEKSVIWLSASPNSGYLAGLSEKQVASIAAGFNSCSSDMARYKLYPHMSDRTYRKILRYINSLGAPDEYDNAERDAEYEQQPVPYDVFVSHVETGNGYYLIDAAGVSFCDIDSVQLFDRNVSLNDVRRVNALLYASLVSMQSKYRTLGFYMNSVQFDGRQGIENLYYTMADVSAGQMPVNYDLTAMWNDLQNHERMYVEQRVDMHGNALHYLTTRKDADDVKNVASWLHYKAHRQNPFVKVNSVQTYLASVSYLTDEQKAALQKCLTSSVSFLCGGPGRGKTTVISHIVNAWHSVCDGGSVICLAPTGKAANRMSSVMPGTVCGTIARFLGMNMFYKDAKRYRSGTILSLEGETVENAMSTLVVIDETSMVPICDVAKLISYIDCCTVVFVGDNQQLRPITPGDFLNECIQCSSLPIAYLTKNMRAKQPELVTNADKISRGEVPTVFDCTSNFMFDFIPPQAFSDDKLCALAVRWYMDSVKQSGDYRDVFLMSPYRAVTSKLNVTLQNMFVPKYQGVPPVITDAKGRQYISAKGYPIPDARLFGNKSNDGSGYELIRVMDRVMCCKNSADKQWFRYAKNDLDGKVVENGTGVWNGDIGVVMRYYPPQADSHPTVLVQFDDGRCSYLSIEACKAYTLAYAMTVHKAQGSEASYVVFVLPYATYAKPTFLNRNLIYTAVTRAKESIAVIGSKDTFARGVENMTPDVTPDLSYVLSKLFGGNGGCVV